MAILVDSGCGNLGEGTGEKLACRCDLSGWILPAAGCSKLTLALLAGRYRDLLGGRAYRVAMRVLAVLLGVFALLLFREGLKNLGVI